MDQWHSRMGGGRELADQWDARKAWHPRERRRYKGTAPCGMGSVVVLLQYNLNMKLLVGDRNVCCDVCVHGYGCHGIASGGGWLGNSSVLYLKVKQNIAHVGNAGRIQDFWCCSSNSQWKAKFVVYLVNSLLWLLLTRILIVVMAKSLPLTLTMRSQYLATCDLLYWHYWLASDRFVGKH